MGGIDPSDRGRTDTPDPLTTTGEGARSREDSGTTTLPGTDDTPGAYPRPYPVAAGTLLAGRYRIEDLLGKGGMGEVYGAHDTLLDQPVAVKLLGARKNGAIRLLVREELRASQALTHRNIARTHTLEEMDGELFIVMERLRGETLAARQKRGAMPLADALATVDQLLAALAAAHARGVVHRDVKPANIMLCDDGRVVLMDFGLAEFGHDGPTVDRDRFGVHSMSVRGTPAYMAPEVAAGLRADVRADLYAVGLILFELIAGEPAFKARSSAELLHRQLHEPIDVARAGAPARIADVMARLIAKDPADRFAGADEVRAALAPPALISRRRAPQLAALAVATAAGVAILYAATRAPRVGTSLAPPATRATPVEPDPAAEAQRLRDDGVAAFDAGNFPRARDLLRRFLRASPGPHPDIEARLRAIEARLRATLTAPSP